VTPVLIYLAAPSGTPLADTVDALEASGAHLVTTAADDVRDDLDAVLVADMVAAMPGADDVMEVVVTAAYGITVVPVSDLVLT
jgi:hypothetical protein